MLKRDEITLLGLIEGIGAASQRELDGLAGKGTAAIVRRLERKGLIAHGWWSSFRGRDLEDDGPRLATTDAGEIALKVALGRDCEWCDRPASEGRRLHRASTFVFFCAHHREIGEASAETETAEKGSLHGLIRTGRIQSAEPAEVANTGRVEPHHA